MNEFQRTVIWLLIGIALNQSVQTYILWLTPAQAGGAMPVIIDGISSRAANDPHALPVEMRRCKYCGVKP